MANYRFTATPLTPIHVGTGETLDTSRYLVDGDRLVEISMARLAANLSAEELADFTRLAEGNNLKRLRDFLSHRADAERDGIATIRVSRTFAERFREKQYDPRSRLLVNPMTRNYHAGTPYLPGSAIKGALRTALVSCIAETDEAFQRVAPRDGRSLEERALGFDFRQGLHEDPFRTVKVADADLPADATVVSRFVNLHRNPEKPGSKGIEEWYERLLSRADGVEPSTFTVEIEVDEAHQRHGDKNLVGSRICLDDLREAANRFYARRIAAEWGRFHSLGHMKTGAALGRAFGANGVLTLPKVPALLLRIGRFSHFESLSVDNLREGYCPQARTPQGKKIKEGNTRNLCVLDGGTNVPFGWLLLTPVAGDRAEAVRQTPRFRQEVTSLSMASTTRGAGVGPPPSVAVVRPSPEELARRQGMKIGDWLKDEQHINPQQYVQWVKSGDPRALELRTKFQSWKQGK